MRYEQPFCHAWSTQRNFRAFQPILRGQEVTVAPYFCGLLVS